MPKVSSVLRHLSFVLLLASCVSAPLTSNSLPAPTATNVSALPGTAVPPPLATAAPVQEQTLRVWLPPQFAVGPETPQGNVLQAQLTEFETTQRWKVETRVKKAIGQGGLVNALQSSLQAAPSAAPEVIALESQMLISVASLLQPISITDTADYYPFSLPAARVNNQLLALPFAADTVGLAYPTSTTLKPPTLWSEFKRENGPLWLPLGDPTATITLQQYAALGGQMTEAGGKPFLDATLLAEVLGNYQTMQTGGLLASGSIKAIDASETWTAYREGRGRFAAVTVNQYLADRARVTATGFTLLPSRNGNRLAYATQWSYVIVTTDPARRAVALELIRFLTSPERLGAWTFAAGVLPPRKSVLNVWADSGVKTIASETLAAIAPSPPTMNALSQPVANAVQAVLSGQALPEAAATSAAEVVNKR